MTAQGGLLTGNSVVRSRWLGEIESDPKAELFFPTGLPGFENEHTMLPVEIPSQRPLVYLQSVGDPEICFAAFPVFVIDSCFRLRLSEDERSLLELPEDHEPMIGADVLCLALLISCGDEIRANLNAPVVINLHNSRAIQCVSPGNKAAYFHLEVDGRWACQC